MGIITAFMHDPEVIILHEPTSGLDPLMQSRFTDLVLSEKKRGKTILMSSHIFEEVEKTCDQVVMIKDGRVAMQGDMHALGQSQRKLFIIQIAKPEEAARLEALAGQVTRLSQDRFEVAVRNDQVGALLRLLAQLDVCSLETKKQSLEEIFLHLYEREDRNESDPV